MNTFGWSKRRVQVTPFGAIVSVNVFHAPVVEALVVVAPTVNVKKAHRMARRAVRHHRVAMEAKLERLAARYLMPEFEYEIDLVYDRRPSFVSLGWATVTACSVGAIELFPTGGLVAHLVPASLRLVTWATSMGLAGIGSYAWLNRPEPDIRTIVTGLHDPLAKLVLELQDLTEILPMPLPSGLMNTVRKVLWDTATNTDNETVDRWLSHGQRNTAVDALQSLVTSVAGLVAAIQERDTAVARSVAPLRDSPSNQEEWVGFNETDTLPAVPEWATTVAELTETMRLDAQALRAATTVLHTTP